MCVNTVETHTMYIAFKQHNPEEKIQVGLNGSVTVSHPDLPQGGSLLSLPPYWPWACLPCVYHLTLVFVTPWELKQKSRDCLPLCQLAHLHPPITTALGGISGLCRRGACPNWPGADPICPGRDNCFDSGLLVRGLRGFVRPQGALRQKVFFP